MGARQCPRGSSSSLPDVITCSQHRRMPDSQLHSRPDPAARPSHGTRPPAAAPLPAPPPQTPACCPLLLCRGGTAARCGLRRSALAAGGWEGGWSAWGCALGLPGALQMHLEVRRHSWCGAGARRAPPNLGNMGCSRGHNAGARSCLGATVTPAAPLSRHSSLRGWQPAAPCAARARTTEPAQNAALPGARPCPGAFGRNGNDGGARGGAADRRLPPTVAAASGCCRR